MRKKKTYKIVCTTQIYNELEKGNLKWFVKYVISLCDFLIVYDDGSTDGSYEYLQKITPYIIRGGKNEFENEIFHKQLLLEKAKELGADFVFYLDADEVLSDGAREKLQKLAELCIEKDIDGIQFHKINVWRSKTWKRIDSLYDIGWFCHFWRIKPDTKFTNIKKGLHQNPYPSTLKKIIKSNEISVLHYGFSNEKNLAYKYLTYKSHGQRGYDMLDRLISEERLRVKRIPQKLFPKELYVENEPRPQKLSFLESLKYVERYRRQVKRPKYSIVCLIYKSTEWLKFVYEQVLKHTNMTDVEFYFVANDATPEVLAYLKDNYIPHYIWNNSAKQKEEWYINNVYRAWNFAAKKAKGDFIIFINSDMAFSENWLEPLISGYSGKNCVTSRLVESGKLKSGQYGIEKNFGRAIGNYQEGKFQEYAKKISEKKVMEGGLFMPLFIKKADFLKVNGYPEGNIVPKSNVWKPKIAKQGEACISGDVVLMEKLKAKGISHHTAFNSLVYHFQEGEMGSKNSYVLINSYIRKIKLILKSCIKLFSI